MHRIMNQISGSYEFGFHVTPCFISIPTIFITLSFICFLSESKHSMNPIIISMKRKIIKKLVNIQNGSFL